MILALSDHIAERLDQLAIRETQLDTKEARVAEVEQAAAAKALELVERAAVLTERQDQLAVRETQLEKKEARVAVVEQAAVAKTLELVERAVVLTGREDRLAIRESKLDKKEAGVNKAAAAAVTKAFDQVERAAVLTEREGRIAEHEVRAAKEAAQLSKILDKAERLLQRRDADNERITILIRHIAGLNAQSAQYEGAAKLAATRNVAPVHSTKYSAVLDHHKPKL